MVIASCLARFEAAICKESGLAMTCITQHCLVHCKSAYCSNAIFQLRLLELRRLTLFSTSVFQLGRHHVGSSSCAGIINQQSIVINCFETLGTPVLRIGTGLTGSMVCQCHTPFLAITTSGRLFLDLVFPVLLAPLDDGFAPLAEPCVSW